MSPLSLPLRSAWDARVSDPGRFRRLVRCLLSLGLDSQTVSGMVYRALGSETDPIDFVRSFTLIIHARTDEEV